MTAQGASSTGRHWAGRPWQALRELSDRTPLRTKLITSLLVLSLVLVISTVFPSINVTGLVEILGAVMALVVIAASAWMLWSARRAGPARGA